MIYYDQGMFEEVNYITSAAPAEMLAGGVNINMVTKDGGNVWKGTARYNFANDSLQAENWADAQAIVPTFRGNPTKKTYDFNLNGGGAIIQNRMWVSGTIRKWVVNKLVNATNPDGSQALDDNDLKNYSGKVVTQVSPNHKVSLGYFWNNKIRGHRRDSDDKIPDIASVVQGNPVQTTQAKYTGIWGRMVYESNFSVMDGQTDYTYQPDADPALPRIIDTVTTEVFNNSTREEHQPNSRHQFDNVVSYSKSGWGGEHLLKGGVQWGRLYYASDYSVRLDHWLVYNDGVPNAVRIFNSPAYSKNRATVTGFFLQDSWSMNRLTLNIGGRWDKYVGTLPEQSAPGGTFSGPRSVAEQEVMNQSIAVGRLGASYDLSGSGRTAIKASYSRYGLQVGIDRVTNVNSLTVGNANCPWSDPNGNRSYDVGEVSFAQCPGFSGGLNTFNASGINWPYSDEVTAGIETQLPGQVRMGVMYYHRSNRDQFGQRNLGQPTSAYTPLTMTVPNGPGGTVQNPVPTTITVYNIDPAVNAAVNNVRDNQDYLDTTYDGVEITATKRFTNRWQMQAGYTVGKNIGGINSNLVGDRGQSSTQDLNDPNLTLYNEGTIGNDSRQAFRLSGSYHLPWELSLAGSLIANNGYPYTSSFSVTRARS
jgi:hypothetical protein